VRALRDRTRADEMSTMIAMKLQALFRGMRIRTLEHSGSCRETATPLMKRVHGAEKIGKENNQIAHLSVFSSGITSSTRLGVESGGLPPALSIKEQAFVDWHCAVALCQINSPSC
jgi:hypothetical protein